MVMLARNLLRSGWVQKMHWLGISPGDNHPENVATKRQLDILSNVWSERGSDHTKPRMHNFYKKTMSCPISNWGYDDYTIYYLADGGLHWYNSGYAGWSSAFELGDWRRYGSSDFTDCYNVALSRLNEKVRGSADITVDAFQWRQTQALSKGCADILKSLSKVRNPKALLKVGGTTWLTWVYGVKPTLQTIYDVATDIGHRYTNEGTDFKARSKVSYDAKYLWYDDGSYLYNIRSNGTLRYEFMVNLRVPETTLTSVARIASLNPVSIAWELTPYSFVADWFINIGGYIRDVETACLYSSYFKHGYIVSTQLANTDLTITQKGSPGLSTWGSQRTTMTQKWHNRTPIYAYPSPKIPAFKAKLGSGRLLNTAALLTNFLK